MELISRSHTTYIDRPVKVIQFGEGNFLRGFVDVMIDIANEKTEFNGSIVLIKPIPFGSLDHFHQQECQYTVSLRGIKDGQPTVINRKISAVKDAVDAYTEEEKYMSLAHLEDLRFVVSNTTEAGIVFDPKDCFTSSPPSSFPGKLTKFLYKRFTFFQGDMDKGLIMLPVELIDDNGIVLKQCVMDLISLWQLGDDFRSWIDNACTFTSTLVDRIITGYPKDHEKEEWNTLGYEDRCLVTGEPFALWVIESDKDISKEFPLTKAGLPVIFTDNQKPYKQRKVRILNGAHTSFVLASYLAGNNIVKESMDDRDIYTYLHQTIFEEVIPTLDLPKEELEHFAQDVIWRFKNPYINHHLLSISLNSVSKWKARCLPSLLEYHRRFGCLPKRLTFSLAALMSFYQGDEIKDGGLVGTRHLNEHSSSYLIMDDMDVLLFFRDHCRKEPKDYVDALLKRADFFGQDLSLIPDLTEMLLTYLTDIRTLGMRGALCKLS